MAKSSTKLTEDVDRTNFVDNKACIPTCSDSTYKCISCKLPHIIFHKMIAIALSLSLAKLFANVLY